MSGPRLGQLSDTLTQNAARAAVAEAEPRIRAIIGEERNRFADALTWTLPFGALAAGSFLATAYAVPDRQKTEKLIGYGAAGAFLIAGAVVALIKAKGPEIQPAPPSGGIVENMARNLAQSIAQEADPKLRVIVQEERERLQRAAGSALPWLGGSTAAFLGTAYGVPDSMPGGKIAGYMLSSALSFYGIWKGLETSKEQTP